MDTPLLATNGEYWAVPWVGGGGPVFFRKLSRYGKIEPDAPTINGHRAPVLSLAFSPFQDNVLASGSDDGTICMWALDEIDKSGQHLMMDAEPMARLSDHLHGVRALEFHPASPVLASAASNQVKFWDLNTQSKCLDLALEGEENAIANVSFNFDGSLAAVATKTQAIHVADPRAGRSVLQSPTDFNSRAQRVVWCTDYGSSEVLLSVGTAPRRGRQIALWDARNLAEPFNVDQVDTATGQLFPLYDEGTGVVLLSGRGDNTIKVYELGPGCRQLTPCSDMMVAGEPLCAIAMLPKQSCDVMNVETMRVLRLTTSTVDPISFILPRADHLKKFFMDDVYVPTRSRAVSQEVDGWLSGANVAPALEDLKPEGVTPLSEKPVEAPKVSKAQITRQQIAETAKEDKRNVESFNRLQAMAVQRSKYQGVGSKGAVKGVDAATEESNDVSDSEWDDDE